MDKKATSNNDVVDRCSNTRLQTMGALLGMDQGISDLFCTHCLVEPTDVTEHLLSSC